MQLPKPIDFHRPKQQKTRIIKDTLASGKDLLISGFRKFQVWESAERIVRNPAKRKSMMLKADRVVTFRCAGKLRDRINGQ